jgi:hypothetical protein
LGFISKVFPGSLAALSSWVGFCIKVDIWLPAVGLRCRISPRPLSQLKTQAIPLI